MLKCKHKEVDIDGGIVHNQNENAVGSGENGGKMDSERNVMNYLVFDRNLANSLRVIGIKQVYYCDRDYSVFHIENDENLLEYIRWEDFSDIASAEEVLLKDQLTILYSLCPAELCGLYAAVSFFYRKKIRIYISGPDVAYNQNVISYSDLFPLEIIESVEVNKVRLTEYQREKIYKKWNEIIQTQSNLRIWKNGKLQNVVDEYFDDDFKFIVRQKPKDDFANILPSIQLLLRGKYHFGINPRYIEWRCSKEIG